MRTRTTITIVLNTLLVAWATGSVLAQRSAYPPIVSRHAPTTMAPRLVRLPPTQPPQVSHPATLAPGTVDTLPLPKTLPVRPEQVDLGELPAPNHSQLAEQHFPAEFTPWWQSGALTALRSSAVEIPIDTDSLIIDALRHSAQVRAISDNALIAETGITRAAAEFDVQTFMETKMVKTSVPTGSTLEAGFNVPRLREQDWFNSAGIRRKNSRGGRFEASQQFGLKDSNSEFFSPINQGNSRLTLGYKQPLLNGAGVAYNESLVVLADIDTRIAHTRTATELQDHLLAVNQAMWELYHQRTVLLQKQRHLERAEVILERLIQRRVIDSLESQIARARSAVAMRQAELIRANTAIRNAEAQVRALVNSPTMLSNRRSELVPTEAPLRQYIPVAIDDAIITALENRPEINAATQEIEAARVRLNVAKNELMPVLDVVLETYVSGLRGQNNIGQALIDQFSVGEPSFTAGLVFEVPLHRRAAKASLQRREVELRQLSSRLQVAIETLHADVEVAVREVETSYQEMQSKYISMNAAQTDVQYIQRRWEELPGDDRSASFLLADLLDAQDRLVFEEAGFARAQVDYTLSLTQLKRATGTLLQCEQIELVRTSENCVPSIVFEKQSNENRQPR